jgi:hypothetical protein
METYVLKQDNSNYLNDIFIKISHKNSHIKRVYPPLKNFQIYIEIAIEELFSLLQEVRVLVFNATFNNISVINV